MKPNFALSLSFEGIRLLHRSGTGWTPVGEVGLDSPDLAGQLAVLRKTALALDPAGLRTKIVLPNEQIRYLSLDTTRASEEDIRRALDGTTPYRLDELVWDVVRGGGRTYIAAVARETLDEAESFALDHRFGPVSFAARPEEFTFIGEPFFGPTKVAGTLLPAGEEVEREPVPVKAAPASARPPRPAEEGEDEGPRPAAEARDDGRNAAQTEPVAAVPPAQGAAGTRSEKNAGPGTRRGAARDGVAADAEGPPPIPAPKEAEAVKASDVPEPEPVPIAHEPVPAVTEPAAEAAAESAPEPQIVFASRSRARASGGVVPSSPPAPPAEKAGAKPVAGAAEPVFGRRSAPPLVAAPFAPVPPPAPAASSGAALRAGPAVAAALPAGPPPALPGPGASPKTSPTVAPPPAGAAPSVARARDSALPAGPAPVLPGPGPTGAATPGVERPHVVPFAPQRPAAPAVAAPAPDPGARITRFPLPLQPGAAGADPRAARPAADARASGKTAGGRPRFLLLILTAILLAAMLIAALWLGQTDNAVSRFFGGGNDPSAVAAAEPVAVPFVPPAADAGTAERAGATPDGTPVPGMPASGSEPGPAGVTPAGDQAAAPSDAAAAAAAALVAEAMARNSAPAEAETETVPAAPTGQAAMVTPEEAERFYASTGVWLRAPRLPIQPEAETLTALVLPAVDATPVPRDAGLLPAGAPDASLAAQAAPLPPGTRLPRDARGFILATPEGTVTPQGLVIYAGAPPLQPPARPGTVAPGPAAAGQEPPAAGQPMTEPPGLRPRARSAGFAAGLPADALTAAAATAEAEARIDPGVAPGGVTLAGLSPPSRPDEAAGSVLSAAPLVPFEGPQPPVRPEGLAPEGAAAVEAAPAPEDPEAALSQTLASIVEGAADPLASATPQAVAVASRPDTRPRNFARAVERQTERLARASTTAREQSAGASLGTPEEAAEAQAEEVAVAAAVPSGNVPRSVAEAATMENVMALREINLIGVYGTPNDRRALVRLENGRYVRVSVGDTLDGGRIAAISDDALSYVRRGRTITLEIPGD
jgi:hypothetical protein